MDLSTVKEEIRTTVKVTDWIGTDKRVDCPEPDCDGKGRKADCQPYDDGWYCFICKTRGDIFRWVMLTQDCTFITALRTLADYAGITIDPNPERSYLLERFYRASVKYLCENPSKATYLTDNRSLDWNTLVDHGIGYCDLEGVVLEASGLTREQMVGLGLVYDRPDGLLNYMGGRFIFPIRTQTGLLVNVKGRANPLDIVDLDPRRKSMPLKADGPWGRHSHMDYLYLEDKISTYQDYVFICEGEPDALTLRSWGINAVGIMTNTGIHKHAHKLAKFQRVYFVLDNDVNTQRHIVSELYLFQAKLPNATVYNVTLPTLEEGKKLDVNDYLKAGFTKRDFHKLAVNSPEAARLVILEWKKHFGKDRAYSAKIYNLIRSLPDRQESLLEYLSSLTNVPVDKLQFAMDTSL